MTSLAAKNVLTEIPRPPGLPLVGNLFNLDPRNPVLSLMRLTKDYGPIFRLEQPSGPVVLVSSQELANELCDESRFVKLVSAPLREVRPFAGDGLFTARNDEPNWRKAHNLLLPNFSAKAMQGYFPMMLDLATQLAQKWERLNPDETIDVADDMTRLTLDTIGLCGFGYRFNSFYRETPHPFVAAMVRALRESQARLRRVPIHNRLNVGANAQFARDIAAMNALVDRIIAERQARGGGERPTDLVGYMLHGVDKESGETLDNVNIRYQIITFLIAGHETTSGLLSFAQYFLLKNPEVLARAREEVDRVLGTDPRIPPTYAQVHQLTYVSQVLEESLRLWPTAPVFAVYPLEDTVIGARYPLARRTPIMVLLPSLHRDPAVWGPDVERFDPDRFSRANRTRLPPNAFKPFGNGQRSCIGRQFALQEATLVLGMILQRFELVDHANYSLKIKETLTLKPNGFTIRVRPRPLGATSSVTIPATAVPFGATIPADLTRGIATSGSNGDASYAELDARAAAVPAHRTPLLVLYGSNLGTAEEIAGEIAREGQRKGYALTIAPLDDYAGRLPRDGAVVIASASYNGTPPDNAARFVARLGESSGDGLAGARYAVFGCGNRDWATTYQAVPTQIDDRLAALGAKRLLPRGEGDARDDFDSQYRAWKAALWPALAAEFGLPAEGVTDGVSDDVAPVRVELIDSAATAPAVKSFGARSMAVRENRELHRTYGARRSDRSTRHLELALPAGVTYAAGDHLGVLPRNHPETIARVLRRFNLDPAASIRIHPAAAAPPHLPLDQPVPLGEVLATCVELQAVASRHDLTVLARHAACPPEKTRLLALAGDDPESQARYRAEVFEPRGSILDLLDDFPSCQVPFETYLGLLPALRPRYYSIASSPLVTPDRAAIAVAVVEGPSRSGHGVYHGVGSTALARSEIGGEVWAAIRKPSLPFHPPENPHQPMIMVGAGTGVAPFRGFLQERAALKERGVPIGESLLFFGCRDPETDFLYADELRQFEAQGITWLRTAFSRLPGQPKRYVQDEIRASAEVVWPMLEAGAIVYVSGDASGMAPEVRRAFREVYRAKTSASDARAEEWLTRLVAAGRYVEDIWGGT